MGQWGNGAMGQWANGAMGQWADEAAGGHLLLTPIRRGVIAQFEVVAQRGIPGVKSRRHPLGFRGSLQAWNRAASQL